ncbi:MAG: hypothetical protein Q9191_004888 [Dirinaria sp. TL-2023a]
MPSGFQFQRKHLMPAFAYRHINSLSPLFWAKTAILVGKLWMDITADIGKPGRIPEHSPIVNVSDLACRTTFDVIGVAAFGNDFRTLQKPDTAIFQDYLRVFYRMGQGSSQILELVLPTWLLYNLPVRRVREIKGAIRAMRDECRTIIERKKAEYTASDSEKIDILSVAMRANAFTEEELTDQMLTFLGAGHATTAVALGWAIYFLAEHPDSQQRLRAEIRTSLPNPATNDMSNACQLEMLPYLNACLNETLRVIPLVPVLQRETVVETNLGGQVIPARSVLAMSLWSLQRCEKAWGPDAAEFRPERWLEIEEQGKKAKHSTLSFGQGPRNCIGMLFARKELETILVGLIGCFNIKPVDHENPLPMIFDVLAKPQEDLTVRIEALDGW